MRDQQGGPRPEKVRMSSRTGNSRRVGYQVAKETCETDNPSKDETASAGIAESRSAKQDASCVIRPFSMTLEVTGNLSLRCLGAQKQMRAPVAERENVRALTIWLWAIPSCPLAISILCPPREQTCHVGATNDNNVNKATKRRSWRGNRSSQTRDDNMTNLRTRV
ncbi:hypothetical protein IAD21_05959 [Abditibacteriota bacterium]|nr:hypothetical protein IAD21_05959 [Abditibacteriota bacterium]